MWRHSSDPRRFIDLRASTDFKMELAQQRKDTRAQPLDAYDWECLSAMTNLPGKKENTGEFNLFEPKNDMINIDPENSQRRTSRVGPLIGRILCVIELV